MLNQVDSDIQKSCMIAKMLKPFRNTHGRGGEGGRRLGLTRNYFKSTWVLFKIDLIKLKYNAFQRKKFKTFNQIFDIVDSNGFVILIPVWVVI